MILTRKLAFQALLLALVQFSLFDQPLYVFVEVGVGKLQFGDAVLVIERDRGAIVDGLAEIIHTHIVAENLARLLLTGHQRRAGEADKGSVGQGIAHVERECIVLRAVRLVGNHDDI